MKMDCIMKKIKVFFWNIFLNKLIFIFTVPCTNIDHRIYILLSSPDGHTHHEDQTVKWITTDRNIGLCFNTGSTSYKQCDLEQVFITSSAKWNHIYTCRVIKKTK